MKELYHGTIYDFTEIDVNAGRGFKDFGKGFYATANKEHAERLAVRNKIIAEKRQIFLRKKYGIKIEPIVAYRYNLIFNEEISALKVKIFTSADTEWLRFIIQNRKYDGSCHDYDIVIGPTADAETTTIINDNFEDLEKSGYSEDICQRVINELKPENLPKQFFFGTQAAIQTLKFDIVKRQVVG